jgi:hypothetical protein
MIGNVLEFICKVLEKIFKLIYDILNFIWDNLMKFILIPVKDFFVCLWNYVGEFLTRVINKLIIPLFDAIQNYIILPIWNGIINTVFINVINFKESHLLVETS